ncbi:glycosyltransferase family 1 protein [Candidatus Parcubacteria bacterium]|nr:MAG: glycosyltransferase family 1 protein [Candidatus Parcubacteria bacterium]
MKIGIDARPLSYSLTGIGFYLKFLLDELQIIDNINEYFLISNAQIHYRLKNRKWHKIEGKLKRKLLSTAWMQVKCCSISEKFKLDLFWSPRHHLPLLMPATIKTVLTVHDMVHHRYPETMSLPNLLAERMLLRRSIRKSNKIITDSWATANDILSIYKVDPSKIRVINPGVPPISYKNEDFGPVPKKYLLFVGTLDPRKNVIRILKAFEQIDPISRGLHLVLVGGKGWKNIDLLRQLDRHRLKSNIHMKGYICREELSALYRNALCLLFPSLYEGFGFPILEAMASGTPVITSNISSMKEVSGDAAYLIDPYNINEIAGAMLDVMENETLRKQMRNKGFQRIQMFSWKECAKKTLQTFNEVMGI